MSTAEANSEGTERPTAVRTLGRYEVLHKIAVGGMATVFLGRTRGIAGFERMVAVKVCHTHLRRDQQFVTMFLDEARLAAQIHHPNVIGTLDVGDDEALYLVMDFVEGGQVSDLIKVAAERGEEIPLPIVLRVMADALAGLHAAHETCDGHGRPLNIIHRDVTPHNILVGTDGVSRLTDFGIAKAEARATVTREGFIKGKLAYTSPEQLLPGGVATRRADVYSAGVVLWEILARRWLFRGKSDGETVRLVHRCEVPPPSTTSSQVPPALDAIVLRAVARDPADRFATAAEFADALEDVGCKLATMREVGAYVQDRLAPRIARQRELVRLFREQDTAYEPTPSAVRAISVRPPPPAAVPPVDEPRPAAAAATRAPAASDSRPPPALEIVPPSRRSWALAASAVALVAALAGAAVYASRPAPASEPARATDARPAPRPSVPTVAEPEAIAPAPPPRAPTPAPTPAAAAAPAPVPAPTPTPAAAPGPAPTPGTMAEPSVPAVADPQAAEPPSGEPRRRRRRSSRHRGDGTTPPPEFRPASL